MLDHTDDVAGIAEMALAAPLSQNDAEGVRLLLEAGADPRRYADDDGAPASAAYEAVQSGCSAELLDLLLAHGAEPDRPARQGRSPYTLALLQGRADLADLLRRYGAADDSTDTDRFLAALQHADQAAVREQLDREPGLAGRLSPAQEADALIRAAETGHTAALTLMLNLGFPIGVPGTELVLKPDAAMPDTEFKRFEAPKLSRVGKVVAAFDNEPENCNILLDQFPDATIVFYLGNISFNGAEGKAELNFSATGPKAAGVVFVEAVKKNGVWSITRLALKLNDSGSVIDLVGGARGDTT